ncbi:hypothetical protein SmJEL517_g04187 [Synchytrium microbalum]|uniref:RRM domain-containing protein n=1 Tax=Synchytrium microbalum TaxID=1806994 RepID=A0A507BSW6_9FUNG|nr:uncharacterized protein SmJEL517_g04187 [Synchytrium microbalum]TPX32680.1 hypothetical protein SmJEL517_g04187 [Synchytrium microbalum]
MNPLKRATEQTPSIVNKKLKMDASEEDAEVVSMDQDVSEEAGNAVSTAQSGRRPQIKLENLLRAWNGVDLRKLFEGVDVKFTRFKKQPTWDSAYLDFNSFEERDKAIQKLNGHMYKNKKLAASIPPVKTPKAKGKAPVKNVEQEEDTRTPAERLADQTTPLWRISYEDQLKEKEEDMKAILLKFKQELMKLAEGSAAAKKEIAWIQNATDPTGLPCPVEPIVPSPVINGYRNKCEFSMGSNFEGEDVVGFLVGLYKEGLVQVLEPGELKHIPPTAKAIAAAAQRFIRQSEFAVYDRITKKGFWRLLLVRTPRSGDVMVFVQINSQGSDSVLVDKEKIKMKAFFEECVKAGEFPLTTLIFQDTDGVFNGIKDDNPVEVVIGPGEIHEEMLNLRFRISPFSFFQVNTPAAELLYTTVREWCRLDNAIQTENSSTTLLDLCCGTGTIGITMASQVTRVVGIEIIASAVQDAEKNAAANGITNAVFVADRVEAAIQNTIKQHCPPGSTVIAVMDPPRPGVHAKVVTAVRECALIDRVVFVACDAEKSMPNWIDLCRPTGGRIRGKPFRIERTQPFDLFPHTKHVEFVLEFVRDKKM